MPTKNERIIMKKKLLVICGAFLMLSAFGSEACGVERFGVEDSTVVKSAKAVKWEKPVKREKFNRGIENKTFMPKGAMFLGGTLSYTSIDAANYQFVLFDNLDASAKLLSGKISYGYTFADNIAIGLSFDYSRNRITIDNVDIALSEDLTFAISDYYSVQQLFTGTAFLRNYINLGDSKRFGLFNDVRVYFAGGQGKIIDSATGEQLVGTYEKITKLGLVLAPGISFFATEFLAIEASIGILGVEYMLSEQITNQVYQGSYENFDASFQLDLFSVGIGLAFYF